jgi:hypothetical protein
LSGEVKFIQEVKSPWIAHVSVERFERGKWHVFALDRKYADLCQVLQVPTEPLFTFFSQFKKKKCPFPAGHVELFENGQITPLPEQTPDSFEGKYRFHLEFTYMKGLEKHVDCTLSVADLVNF